VNLYLLVYIERNGDEAPKVYLVVVRRQYLLCRAHCATKQQAGSGTRRMEWSLRVSEVGPVWVSIWAQNENLVCQHRINSCWPWRWQLKEQEQK